MDYIKLTRFVSNLCNKRHHRHDHFVDSFADLQYHVTILFVVFLDAITSHKASDSKVSIELSYLASKFCLKFMFLDILSASFCNDLEEDVSSLDPNHDCKVSE